MSTGKPCMSITWGAEVWLCKPAPATAWTVKAAYCPLLKSPAPGRPPLPLNEGAKSSLICLLCPRKTPGAALESLMRNKRNLS